MMFRAKGLIFPPILAACFCMSFGKPVLAEVITCSFEKVERHAGSSTSEQSLKDSFGNSFRLDDQKNLLFVEWDRGVSGWMAPDKMSRNASFTSYIFVIESKISVTNSNHKSGRTKTITISYRLDKSSEFVTAQYDLGGNYITPAARYTCK